MLQVEVYHTFFCVYVCFRVVDRESIFSIIQPFSQSGGAPQLCEVAWFMLVLKLTKLVPPTAVINYQLLASPLGMDALASTRLAHDAWITL